MSNPSGITANFATKRSGTLCVETGGSVQLSEALSEKAKAVFDKPYRALVDVLKVSERDAHYRLSGTRKYTAKDIAKLLQSEDGIHFLVVLMEKQRPAWWRAILKMGVLGTIEQRRQNELKLMRRVFDANEATGTKFSDSFRAQDPDFLGVVLEGFDAAEALGGMGGAVDQKR